jgi:uncharacterized membrane protein YhiD involved in acid resistance
MEQKLLELGAVAVVAMMAVQGLLRILFKALESRDQVSQQIITVVKNNTEALTKLCDQSGDVGILLEQHDKQAKAIHEIVTDIRGTVNGQGRTLQHIDEAVSRKRTGST